ncbi:MAG: tRNA-uridine aminocarboxypropyltransferase [Sinobacterium sp.]
MKIFLLTHQRELDRKTNTGTIAVNNTDGMVERIIWERVNPNSDLIELFNNNKALLLYPTDDDTSADIKDFDNIVVIDITWQEAQKIYNRSPYFKAAPKAVLSPEYQSAFQLRRNQREDGLCTIECVIELLRIKDREQLADALAIKFNLFNQR